MVLSDGVCPVIVPALEVYLTSLLPVNVTVQDPALQVLALLRVLYALNTYWAGLYEVCQPSIHLHCFINILRSVINPA